MNEIEVSDSVGESLAANANSLEDAVARQLMHDETGVDHARLLEFVRNQTSATREKRGGGGQKREGEAAGGIDGRMEGTLGEGDNEV